MDLFAALHATWPAAAERRLGPWTLRRGAGGGRRVSAATLDAPPAAPEAALDAPVPDPEPAIAAMRAAGQRPLFMVRRGQAALDAALAARGFAVAAPTVLLAAPAAALAFAPADLTTLDCAEPLAIMAEIWAAGGIGPARLAVMARVAVPKRCLLGRLDDRPAGAAFVAVAGGVAMVHALEVAEWARRRGLGARLSRAAADWGMRRGAASVALAVEAANAPALALHAGLGMGEAGGYHYRVAPV